MAVGNENMLRLGHIPVIKSQGGKIFDKPENFRIHRIHHNETTAIIDHQAGMLEKGHRNSRVAFYRSPINGYGCDAFIVKKFFKPVGANLPLQELPEPSLAAGAEGIDKSVGTVMLPGPRHVPQAAPVSGLIMQQVFIGISGNRR